MKSVRLHLGPKQRLSMLLQAIVAVFTGKMLITIQETKPEKKDTQKGTTQFEQRELTPQEKAQVQEVFSNVGQVFDDADKVFKDMDNLFHRLGTKLRK